VTGYEPFPHGFFCLNHASGWRALPARPVDPALPRNTVIKIDWTLLIQAANFFLLLGILQKLVFKPFLKVMDERRGEVEGSLSRVRELEELNAAQQADYEGRLDAARSVAQEQREAFRREAAEQEAQLMTAAHDDAAAKLSVVRQRIAAEQAEAGALLRQEANTLGEAIARKLAGRAL
jgi:F-type H+-transporting ATPase subunit b